MILMLLALAILSALELLVFLPAVWKHRQYVATGLLLALAVVSGGLFIRQPIVSGLLVLSVGLYRLFNLVRIASSKMDQRRLRRMSWHSSWWLLIAQAKVLVVVLVAQQIPVSGWVFWGGLAVLQIGAAAVLLLATRRQLRSTLPLPSNGAIVTTSCPVSPSAYRPVTRLTA